MIGKGIAVCLLFRLSCRRYIPEARGDSQIGLSPGDLKTDANYSTQSNFFPRKIGLTAKYRMSDWYFIPPFERRPFQNQKPK